jgi:hypothetical protein
MYYSNVLIGLGKAYIIKGSTVVEIVSLPIGAPYAAIEYLISASSIQMTLLF